MILNPANTGLKSIKIKYEFNFMNGYLKELPRNYHILPNIKDT